MDNEIIIGHVPIQRWSLNRHELHRDELLRQQVKTKCSNHSVLGSEIPVQQIDQWILQADNWIRDYKLPPWMINAAVGWVVIHIQKGAACGSLYLEGHLAGRTGLPSRHSWDRRRFFLVDSANFRDHPLSSDSSESFAETVIESMSSMKSQWLKREHFGSRYRQIVWDLSDFNSLARSLDWLLLLQRIKETE